MPWQSPFIMQAVILALLLLLRNWFAEHLSASVFQGDRSGTAKRVIHVIIGLSHIVKICSCFVYFLFCHLQLMSEKSAFFLVLTCLMTSLLALSRYHKCCLAHSMKQVWHPCVRAICHSLSVEIKWKYFHLIEAEMYTQVAVVSSNNSWTFFPF